MIKEYLACNRIFTDGAMGTYYAEIKNGFETACEYANITEPDIIKRIHLEYLKAGANLIRTNTFAANTKALSVDKEELTKLICRAVAIAKEAVNEYVKEHVNEVEEDVPVFIAGDIGPIPSDALTEDEELFDEYCYLADNLIAEGVDAILFETFQDVNMIRRVAEYIKSRNRDLFIMAEVTIGAGGYSGSGMSAGRMLAFLAESDGIDACGFNCGIGSGHMLKLLKTLLLPKDKYLMMSPNAGYPEQMQNRMRFMDNRTYFAKNMNEIAMHGVEIIGACCGTTPEYIKAVRSNISAILTEDRNKTNLKEKEKEHIIKQEIPVAKNYLMQLFESGKKVIAVELDPPYDAQDEKVINASKVLKEYGIDIITIADSPMGKSRIDSILMAQKIHRITGMQVMPHICCRDKNMISMRSTLLGAYINDIRNLLIVTGDPVPEGIIKGNTTAVFDYNSIQLMKYVKEMNEEHFKDDPFVYGGALNYSLKNADKIAERMQRKIEAGAGYFLTQPVYSDDDVERIRYLKDKTGAKILCGIMPLVSYKNAFFIKNEMTGIYLPDEILQRYHENMTREEGETAGAEIAVEIMDKLNPVADGYYFMLPFNRVSLMKKIYAMSS